MSVRTPAMSTAPEPSLRSAAASVEHRKVRKGTRSCWPCKRRKVRCSFQPSNETRCTNCQRRGSTCIGQELPEELSPSKVDQHRIGDRIVRVEALVNSLAKRVSSETDATSDTTGPTTPRQYGVPTPSYSDAESTSVRLDQTVLENHRNGRQSTVTETVPPAFDWPPRGQSRTRVSNLRDHGEISRALLAAFPSHEDTDILYKAVQIQPIYSLLLNTHSSAVLGKDGPRPLDPSSRDLKPVSADTHPVLIAKQMLNFSVFLQRCDRQDLGLSSLSEDLCGIMVRLAEAAISLVTTNEELFGSMESLECMMMEGVFQMNGGNFRRAWFAYRRAMVAAQLMGIHRPSNRAIKTIDPMTKLDPQFVWFRIVYHDRYLCLLMGYPQASHDVSMASDAALANDDALGRLDRGHAVIASRILQRNEDAPSEHDLATTHAIDEELLKLAKSTPAKFWLPTNLYGVKQGSQQDFWESWRGASQVFHFNLLNQLHLPYLLRFSPDGRYDYSKLACMNASREILARFTTYRSQCNASNYCLPFNYFTLMAAMTLLLAHLDTHLHNKASSFPAHQRLCDRIMMEQVVDTMSSMCQANEDNMTKSSIRILHCLLRIEEDASEGNRWSARSLQESSRRQQEGDEYQEHGPGGFRELRICIPYFGTIKIANEGVVGREPAQETFGSFPNSASQGGGDAPSETDLAAGGISLSEQLNTQPLVGNLSHNMMPASVHAHDTNAVSNGPMLLDHDWSSSIDAGVQDWDFQDIGTAFFDNLMRNA